MKPAVAFLGIFLFCLAGCARGPKPTALEAASGALEELRSAVVREIKDSDRAAQGARLVDELQRLLAEADADLKAHDAGIRALNADYNATAEAFRAAFREFNAKRNAHLRRILDINQRGKALLTAEEWKVLGKVREEALEKLIEAGRES